VSFVSSLGSALGGVGLGEAVVAVSVDTTALKRGLEEARGEVQAGTTTMGSALTKLGPAIALAGTAALVAFGAKSVQAFQAS
jgi:hypothetical protein